MEDPNPRAVIGANNPPPFDAEAHGALAQRVNDFILAAGDWMDLGEIETEEQSQKLTDFVAGARKTFSAVEDARKAAKKPHDDAGAAVQAAFAPLAEKIKRAADRAKLMQSRYLAKKQAEEAERKRRELAEAEERRKDAELAAAQAATRNDIDGEVEAEAALKAAQKDIKAASRATKTTAQSATGGGRTMSLRTIYSAQIENINHAFVTYRDHPEVAELLIRLANAEIRSQAGEKAAPKGFTLKEEKKAA